MVDREAMDLAISAFGLGSCGRKQLYASSGQDVYRIRACFSDTPYSRRQVYLAHEIKERLNAFGFPYTDRFKLTSFGEPFVSFDSTLFVAEKWHGVGSAAFSEAGVTLDVVRSLAKMHQIISRQRLPRVGGFDGCGVRYGKAAANIKSFAKKARSGRPMSDFDLLFLNTKSRLLDIIEQWYEMASACGLDEAESHAVESGNFRHSDLRDETVLFGSSNTFFTQFCSISAGLHLYDLAAIISKHFRSSPRPVPVSTALRAYGAANPLTDADMTILYIILFFPEKELRLLGSYYEKKRAFAPSAFCARYLKMLDNRDSYLKYISELL